MPAYGSLSTGRRKRRGVPHCSRGNDDYPVRPRCCQDHGDNQHRQPRTGNMALPNQADSRVCCLLLCKPALERTPFARLTCICSATKSVRYRYILVRIEKKKKRWEEGDAQVILSCGFSCTDINPGTGSKHGTIPHSILFDLREYVSICANGDTPRR